MHSLPQGRYDSDTPYNPNPNPCLILVTVTALQYYYALVFVFARAFQRTHFYWSATSGSKDTMGV